MIYKYVHFGTACFFTVQMQYTEQCRVADMYSQTLYLNGCGVFLSFSPASRLSLFERLLRGVER